MTLLSTRQRQKGSVVLVALCFLAVLGIALASYLAVSTQAMKLSNRSYQQSISAQLAEGGIEQCLWSFGWNNWSAWDTSIPRTAIRHISYPATKYNNGVLGSITLRVDRYDATVWNNFTSYSSANHDIVWYQGVWYQCKIDDTAPTAPSDNSGKWISAPAPWSASANYTSNNIVLYGDSGGIPYRCQASNVNTPPIAANIAYWTALSGPFGAWDSGTNYAADNVVLYGGTSYRCIIANSNEVPPDADYWVATPTVYAEGSAVPPDSPTNAIKTQLRAIIAPAPLFPNAIAANLVLNLNSGNPLGLVDSYNTILSPSYNSAVSSNDTRIGFSAVLAGGNVLGTAVQISGGTIQGYVTAPPLTSAPYGPRASLAGTLKGIPAGTGIDLTRVSRSPSIPQFDFAQWDSNRVYRVNDVVRSDSSPGADLYLCLVGNKSQPLSNTFYWKINALLSLPSNANLDIGHAGFPLIPEIYRIDNLATGNVYLNDPSETITIKGPVILNIPGYLMTDNDGKIIIENTGSAEIHVGDRIRIRGHGGIDNLTHNPKKLILLCSAGNTPFSHSFSSTTPLYGVIYMPNATAQLRISNSGVAGDPDPTIYGAISAKNITFNSPANFHYDTSLRTATFGGVDTPFLVTDWRELTDPTEKVVLP